MIDPAQVIADARRQHRDYYLGATAQDACAIASAAFKDFAGAPRAILRADDRKAIEQGTQRMEGRLMQALDLLREADAFKRLADTRQGEIVRGLMGMG
ncbi:MAG: hypothetical protein JNJ82_15425 [Opitutaceae bacterium]|nr:hypothetical protein [Opitutaceae bacterium]